MHCNWRTVSLYPSWTMLKESPKIHFNESGSTCVQAHQPKKNTQDPQAVTVLLNSCSLVTRLFLNFWCSSYWPQIIVAAMRPELWADFWWCDMSGRLWWYPATCFQTSKEDSHLHVFFWKATPQTFKHCIYQTASGGVAHIRSQSMTKQHFSTNK